MRRLLLFLFSHRFLAIARWELHFIWTRAWNTVTWQKGRIARTLAGRARPLYLNLGSGPRGLAHHRWINVDGFKNRNVHFLLDFSRRMPFLGGTFDGVFCEHVLEHFSLEDGQRIASEVRRILAPGGCFRIVVPDAELVIRRYIEAPETLIAWRGEDGTAMETVNSFFRQRYEHQFLYDWRSMEQMLLRVGFKGVSRTAFGTGCLPELALDDTKYEWESLYVEAFNV